VHHPIASIQSKGTPAHRNKAVQNKSIYKCRTQTVHDHPSTTGAYTEAFMGLYDVPDQNPRHVPADMCSVPLRNNAKNHARARKPSF